MTDDHIFINNGTFIDEFNGVRCKYCGYETFKNNIGEYLLLFSKKCLTNDEKIIKDLIE